MTKEQAARLAEIRVDHQRMEHKIINSYLPRSSFPLHADRAFLLALVDEQAAEIERQAYFIGHQNGELQKADNEIEAERAKVEKLREALTTARAIALGWLSPGQLAFKPLPDVLSVQEQLDAMKDVLSATEPT